MALGEGQVGVTDPREPGGRPVISNASAGTTVSFLPREDLRAPGHLSVGSCLTLWASAWLLRVLMAFLAGQTWRSGTDGGREGLAHITALQGQGVVEQGPRTEFSNSPRNGGGASPADTLTVQAWERADS